MIVEIVDLAHPDGPVVAHIPELPECHTLGDAFDRHVKLREIAKYIVNPTLNGVAVADWRSLSPKKGDRFRIEISPHDFGIAEITLAISIATLLLSVVRFIVSLVTAPKPTKANTGARESNVYNFEGIHDSFSPGNPVPVIYGRMRVGVQLLMYYVDVVANGRGQEMSMLCGVCEGEVLCIKDVELNGTLATDIASVTVTTRLGTNSQTVITGFDRVKNTFSDGRQISTLSIIYTTASNVCKEVDLQVMAPNGMFSLSSLGKLRPNAGHYSVGFRKLTEPNWTTVYQSRPVAATTQKPYFDTAPIKFPSPDKYQISVTWQGADKTGMNDQYNLNLQNVTEYEDVLGPLSGTALIAIKAAATAQLNTGRPTVTALVYGKLVKVYDSTLSSYSIAWTDNPAWCVLDYATNSIYGMGGYASTNDFDLQSVYDFATLANSRATVCP